MKWSIPEKVIARGRQYLQEGRVLSVVPDQEENVWHAEVLGSELYMVDLDGTAKEIDYCQCPYWEEHKYCKHTVAVELYLRSKNLSRIMKKDQPMLEPVKATSEGEIIAKGFSRLKTQNNPQAVQPLIIEYQVETIETNQYHPELSILALYLRIGSLASPKKTYIVKNIYDFLQAYTEKETYTVNKQYQFRLDKRAFQKEDQKILTHLAGSAQTHQLLGTNGLQVKGKLDKRYLLLPVEQARFLLEQMNQTTRLHLQINEQNDQGIQFSDQNKPLSFKVEKFGEDYLLQALNDFDFFFMHYQWGVIQGTFYSLTKYQQTVYQTWKQLIRRLEKPEVVFKKKELPSLFKEIIPLLSEIGDVAIAPAVEGTIHVPKNQGLIIQNQLEKSNATFSESFQTMVQDLIHPERYQAQLPKGLNATMRDYQKQGFRWLKMLGHYQFGGILADEMGLGKTLQTIAFLLSEKEERKSFSALIVAPASLIYNWQAEVRKFAPSLSIQVINGNKKEREELLAKDTDIRVTSYASLRQDLANYQSQKIDYLILDEAQMVKNSSTKTAQALRELAVPQRFALSGTPIENNLEELWSLFATIMPGFFPTKTKFRELAAEEIAQMIRPFILRRDKQTVLKDLPEKTEMNLYSALTEEQKTVYLAYLRQMREEITSMDSEAFKKNRIGILAGLTRLRQICCDPRLFIEDYQGGSGKLEQVKDLLVAAKENKRRVLLFSQFTGMLTILQEELAELGISTFYLRGSTKPQDRLSMVDAFNAGEKDVFLISLKAGGTGLNLTGADTVILYDLWWNPAIEEQAAGRAHRIGQKNVVEVWRMISEGTIEERMDSLQQEKRELFQKVIQGNEEQLTKLTEEDIRMILSVGEIEE
ncbi:TPA: DEAD/DEAH box helicase family protein [Enterococcus faecium]|nr:DEAD/DEAH box helicase family protein [Enterococcus faecium]